LGIRFYDYNDKKRDSTFSEIVIPLKDKYGDVDGLRKRLEMAKKKIYKMKGEG